MTEEEYLREMLAMLHQQYLKDAQPYIDRLASIAATRPPSRAYFTIDEFNAWAEGKNSAAIKLVEEVK